MRVYACVHMHRICLKAAAGMMQACDDAPAISVAWSDAWSQFLPDRRSIQKPMISLHYLRTSCTPPSHASRWRGFTLRIRQPASISIPCAPQGLGTLLPPGAVKIWRRIGGSP